jgi:hypothetical protein
MQQATHVVGVAAEVIVDLERIHGRKKAADRQQPGHAQRHRPFRRRPPARRSRRHHSLPDPRSLRVVERHRTPAAPPGQHVRHRLSRAGNRQINRVLHITAVVQLPNPTEGRAYFDRRVAEGKTPTEAMRALKRKLCDIVYRQMILDAKNATTSPGGRIGNDCNSSAAGSHPHTDTPDQTSRPVPRKPRTPLPAAS